MFRTLNWCLSNRVELMLAAVALVVACSTGLKEEEITAENEAALAERVTKELSYEEVQLLQGYLQRTYPDLPEGQLPAGRTIGEMIVDQRALEQTIVQETEPDPSVPAVPTTKVLPSGTVLRVRLAEPLSSRTNQAGELFEAYLDEDLLVDKQLVAPEGSRVVGRITNAEKSGRVQGRARMSLTLSEIHAAETVYPLETSSLSFEAKSTRKKDATKIGIGTGAGAVIGAIAGGKKGAAIGSAVGAGAGTGVVLATSGEEIEFRTEQPFQFKLKNDVEMKILQRSSV